MRGTAHQVQSLMYPDLNSSTQPSGLKVVRTRIWAFSTKQTSHPICVPKAATHFPPPRSPGEQFPQPAKEVPELRLAGALVQVFDKDLPLASLSQHQSTLKSTLR